MSKMLYRDLNRQRSNSNSGCEFKKIFPTLLIFIACLNIITGTAQSEQECCTVEEAEIRRFQHIRELSHQFLIILGVQKSGTTVLFDVVDAHPQTAIAISKQGQHSKARGPLKELHFFDTPNLKFENYIKSFNLSALEGGKTMFEGTPEYLQYAGGACLIKYYLPKAKFIVVMKNPSKRALSSFKVIEYHKLCGRLGGGPCNKPLPSFYNVMKHEIENFKKRNCDLFQQSWQQCMTCYPQRNYLKRGFYGPQLRNWLQYLSPKQFLIVHSDETKNKQELANKVYEFANLAPYELNVEKVKGFRGIPLKNYSEDINRTLALLEEFYEPYNQMLYDTLAKDFNIHNFTFH